MPHEDAQIYLKNYYSLGVVGYLAGPMLAGFVANYTNFKLKNIYFTKRN